MQILDPLKQNEFAILATELSDDISTVFMVYHELVVIAMNTAIENEWSYNQLINELNKLNIQFDEESNNRLTQVTKRLSLDNLVGPNKLKLRLQSLAKKTGWTKGHLEDLMEKVISFNSSKIISKAQGIAKLDLEAAAYDLSTRSKKMALPFLNESFPARSVFIRKSVERGKLMVDTLRDTLTRDLRASMAENNIHYAPGANVGKINPKVIKDFELRMTSSFQNYTKKDPRFKVPTHVHQIAVTEVRSTVNSIKKEYMTKFVAVNNLVATKTWIHNGHLSVNSRMEHVVLNAVTIPIDAKFTISSDDGKYVTYGPHDNSLPASQVIGCNCDLVYSAKRKKEDETRIE